jgi:hypothetical protein
MAQQKYNKYDLFGVLGVICNISGLQYNSQPTPKEGILILDEIIKKNIKKKSDKRDINQKNSRKMKRITKKK